VPRYENRRKSLADVNLKLNGAIESADLGVHITELRKSALEAELSRLEELKKAAQQEYAKKSGKKDSKFKDNGEEMPDQIEQTDKPRSMFEEEIKSKKKSLFSDETDTPDSDSGKKLW
jgi:restriction endonuclease S subunit